MNTTKEIELPDDEWYSKQSSIKKLPTHCPLATIDKCPRYYLSQKLINTIAIGALNIDSEEKANLDNKWKFSDAFSNNDLSAGIFMSKEGILSGVDGFCPEVTANYLGLYCGSLHSFVDDDHQKSAQKMLTKMHVSKRDPRYLWGLVEPLHFSHCSEFATYGSHDLKAHAKPKQTKGKISPKVRWLVFERDSFACQYCGARGGENSPLQVDHRISIANGGTDELDNLVTSCLKCNSGKGAKSIEL